MRKRYSKKNYYNWKFFQLGKELFNASCKGMSNNDRVVYAVLRDRFELSINNGWVDEEDHIYFYFEQEKLAEECRTSLKTVQRSVRRMIQMGLIDIVRGGKNRPNRFYLLKPESQPQKEGESRKEESQEEIMKRRYSKNDYKSGKFYQLGKELFNETYKDISNNDRVVYAVLRDRFELSINNGWVDDEDHIYFYFEQEKLAEECRISLKTVQRSIRKLFQMGLIDFVRPGQNQPNRLYLLMTEEEPLKEEESKIILFRQVNLTCQEDEKTPENQDNISMTQIDLCGQVKLTSVDKSNCPTNETKYIKTDRNDTDTSSVLHPISFLEQKAEEKKKSDFMVEPCAFMQAWDHTPGLSLQLSAQIQELLCEICSPFGQDHAFRVDGGEFSLNRDMRESFRRILTPKLFTALVKAAQFNTEPIRNLKAFLLACLYNFLHGNMRLPEKRKDAFNDFAQNDYDFDLLEKEILCN